MSKCCFCAAGIGDQSSLLLFIHFYVRQRTLTRGSLRRSVGCACLQRSTRRTTWATWPTWPTWPCFWSNGGFKSTSMAYCLDWTRQGMVRGGIHRWWTVWSVDWLIGRLGWNVFALNDAIMPRQHLIFTGCACFLVGLRDGGIWWSISRRPVPSSFTLRRLRHLQRGWTRLRLFSGLLRLQTRLKPERSKIRVDVVSRFASALKRFYVDI